jgi:outer membrane protein
MLSADAENRVVSEARSAYYPTAAANITSTAANDASTLAVGAVQTSSLNTRFASGVNLVQLVTDFGRTKSLVNVARLRYRAASDNVINVRAQILLQVRHAYFDVLGSEAVLRAARATLQNRQVTLRQVNALAQSSLRSTLDVTFAQVLVSEAQLAVDQAEDDAQASQAVLAAALGSEAGQTFVLDDEPVPGALEPDLNSLVADALRDRPDLNILQHNRDAAYQFAQAEKKLSYPTVSLLAVGGAIPEHDHTIAKNNYEAAGVNINIPIFNGGLFASRHAEALARAQAADKDIQDLSVQISKDVRIAWFNANNAYRRLAVTSQLVDQARRAMHLAQARYDAGLGSIVELNQAQTSEISAEINAANAKYEYLSRRTELDFEIGALR